MQRVVRAIEKAPAGRRMAESGLVGRRARPQAIRLVTVFLFLATDRQRRERHQHERRQQAADLSQGA